MGNRLSKIVTKTGDDGTTGLASGERIAKDDSLIEAIGVIDELNSSIGLVRCVCTNSKLQKELKELQNTLFNYGGDLCLEGSLLIKHKDIETLDDSIQSYNQSLLPLKNFVLPAGSELTARLHMSRSICRRAERRVVSASKSHEFNPLLKVYINRLSDWLFVVARVTDETEEELWNV
ncbi:MAG: cob(I)yrinic acid a,c-diamide adenosyltransferase [Xanthomonadales bacterium]|nr:cob(I)yrinic acid a,c-diamide adenosyltransferase [Xanthomonadales bacterium]